MNGGMWQGLKIQGKVVNSKSLRRMIAFTRFFTIQGTPPE